MSNKADKFSKEDRLIVHLIYGWLLARGYSERQATAKAIVMAKEWSFE